MFRRAAFARGAPLCYTLHWRSREGLRGKGRGRKGARTVLDVCLLGTGGMMPLPNRWLASMLLRCNGRMILVDCGEGTQIPMKMAGWGFKAIDAIFFTHYHADHVSGLPGLLLTISNSGKDSPLDLIGPQGLRRVVEGLLTICPALPFDVRLFELPHRAPKAAAATGANGGGREAGGGARDAGGGPPEAGGGAQEAEAPRPLAPIELFGNLSFSYVPADHSMPCLSYAFELRRQGMFDAERAKAEGIPLPFWRRLQNGETIAGEDGRVFTPDMVLGPERRGIKLAYCTDSRPTPLMPRLFEGADLLVCEGLYGDDAEQANAASKKHMVYREAAELARAAGVGELWLTHFSPAMPNPGEHIDCARRVFPNSRPGKDLLSKTLSFID